MCPRRGCLRILVIYYTQAMCRNISSPNEMIIKSAQLRLGDFIQPKNCKILKSGGNIFCVLKGSFTIFLFSVRSHILVSNGVWYWWFCPEGPKNAQNSRFLGFYFVPAGDLDSQRQGTLTGAASRGPLRCESRSHVALRVKVPWGQNKNPKILSFGHF